jgi:ribulose-5-phosphate 4-epimerase/fuculose-1-phosphate aldolase
MNQPKTISSVEWDARCELAALYRIIAQCRMIDLIDTHLTLRVPGAEHHFLINRYGVLFDRMKASDLILVDQNGNAVDRDCVNHQINVAGFVIHSAVHMARPDLTCVIHTHTAAGMAVAAQEHGLLPISQHALKFYGKLAYHTYEGIALSLDERKRLIRDLGPHKAMILRNHGLLVGGGSVAKAFHEIHFLELACQAQIQALAGGSKLVFPSEEVRVHTSRQFDGDDVDRIIDMSWNAALTLIEDQRASYCS